jgi:hypothetical protein
MRLFLSSARDGTAWQIAPDGIKLDSDFDHFRIDQHAHLQCHLPSTSDIPPNLRDSATFGDTAANGFRNHVTLVRKIRRPSRPR